MAKTGDTRDGLSEAFQEGLAKVAQALLGLGGLVTLVTTGLLIVLCMRVQADHSTAQAALKNVALLKEVLLFGAVGVAVGSSYVFWGEEIGPIILLVVSAILFFAPTWGPMIVGETQGDVITQAFGAITTAGTIMGGVAVLSLVIDVVGKARQRVKIGVKADQMKYGKGVQEEKDRRNVFLGKCWQLPYCRKFVRERCPIYHARRTCWRERVGCMCEEEVIRKAMENKPISKDQVLDGSNIPRNHKLNEKQKAERCRNCIIYNEHQRHKYKALVPAVVLAFALVYLGGHTVLIGGMAHILALVDKGVRGTIMDKNRTELPVLFLEGMLFTAMTLALSYAMKALEYAVFKLKL